MQYDAKGMMRSKPPELKPKRVNKEMKSTMELMSQGEKTQNGSVESVERT